MTVVLFITSALCLFGGILGVRQRKKGVKAGRRKSSMVAIVPAFVAAFFALMAAFESTILTSPQTAQAPPASTSSPTAQTQVPKVKPDLKTVKMSFEKILSEYQSVIKENENSEISQQKVIADINGLSMQALQLAGDTVYVKVPAGEQQLQYNLTKSASYLANSILEYQDYLQERNGS